MNLDIQVDYVGPHLQSSVIERSKEKITDILCIVHNATGRFLGLGYHSKL